MTITDVMGLGGLIVGLVSLGVTVYFGYDARQQRTKREKAVITAHVITERTYGLLIGIKPAVKSIEGAEDAINDGLAAIKALRPMLNGL